MDSYSSSPSFPPLPLPPLPPVYDPARPFVLQYAQQPPRRVWTVFVTLVVAFIAGQLGGAFVLSFMLVLRSRGAVHDFTDFREALVSAMRQPAILLASGAGTQAMLLMTALSAAFLSRVPLIRRLRLVRSSLSPLGYIITPIGGLSVSFLFAAVVTLLGIHESGTLKYISEMIQHLDPLEVVLAVLVVGIAPGFAEEFLFRGYVQTRLVQRWGRWAGICITAVLFGIMHFDLIQSPFAAAFGIYLGYLAEKSGSIRPTMVCHAVNNSVQVLLARYSFDSDQQSSRPAAAAMGLIALGILMACLVYLRYRVRSKGEPAVDMPVQPPVDQTVPAIV